MVFDRPSTGPATRPTRVGWLAAPRDVRRSTRWSSTATSIAAGTGTIDRFVRRRQHELDAGRTRRRHPPGCSGLLPGRERHATSGAGALYAFDAATTGSSRSTRTDGKIAASTGWRATTTGGRTSAASTCCRRRGRPGRRCVDRQEPAEQLVARGRPGPVRVAEPSAGASPSAAPSPSPGDEEADEDAQAVTAVIPLRDANPTRRTPVVTLSLIIGMCFVAFGMGARGPGPGRRGQRLGDFPDVHGVVPADLTAARAGRQLDVAARARHRDHQPVPARRAGCTCWATCSTCGSSATTSRTGWAGPRSSLFYLVGGDGRGRRPGGGRPERRTAR